MTGKDIALPPSIKASAPTFPPRIGAAIVSESSGKHGTRRLLASADNAAAAEVYNATFSGKPHSDGGGMDSAETAAEMTVAHGLVQLVDGNSSTMSTDSASLNSTVEAEAIDVSQALNAAGASWTVVLLLAIASMLLGTVWLLLLGEFTTTLMYVNLSMVPIALLVAGVYFAVSTPHWYVAIALIALCAGSVAVLYAIRDSFNLTFALLSIASKALSANYSLVAIAVGLSFVQIVWLGLCFLFIGLSFMSGQAIVVPLVAFEDKADSARCLWETDGWAYIGMMFIVLVMLWTNAVLGEVKKFVISGGIALWYFHPSQGVSPQTDAEHDEISRGWGSNSLLVLNWALSASFGSLCVSSLLTGPCELLRALFQPRPRDDGPWGEGTFEADEDEDEDVGCVDRARNWYDGVCRKAWNSMGLEDLIGFVDRMAVPLVAMTGYPFLHSSKSVTYLLDSTDLRQIVADRTSYWVLRGASAVLAFVSAVCAALLYTEYLHWAVAYQGTSPAARVSQLIVWVVFWGSLIASSLVLQFFAGALLDAMDVLFLLYAVDRHHQRVGRRGTLLHEMLTGMRIGKANSGKRYTPRGWTYVGSGTNSHRSQVDNRLNTARRNTPSEQEHGGRERLMPSPESTPRAGSATPREEEE